MSDFTCCSYVVLYQLGISMRPRINNVRCRRISQRHVRARLTTAIKKLSRLLTEREVSSFKSSSRSRDHRVLRASPFYTDGAEWIHQVTVCGSST